MAGVREEQRSPRAAAHTPPVGCREPSPSVSLGAEDLQVAPPVPSSSPQGWSGTSLLGQYSSKRNDFLMGFEMVNHINQTRAKKTVKVEATYGERALGRSG